MIADCGWERMLLVLDNKVELNYQLGHLITASQAALIVSIQ